MGDSRFNSLRDFIVPRKPFADSWQLQYTVPWYGSYDISMNLYNAISMKIDWGDASSNTYTGNTTATHTYSSGGSYTVTITGPADWIDFALGRSYALTKVLTPIGKTLGNALVDANYPGYSGAAGMFERCYKLNSIPAGLFKKCKNAKLYDNVFQYCLLLSTLPPGGIFFDGALRFPNTFQASGITKIPSDLFLNCPNITSFYFTFDNCASLRDLTADVFNGNLLVDNFRQTFASNGLMTGVAPELWTRSPHPTYHADCFHGCSSLTNWGDIPADWT